MIIVGEITCPQCNQKVHVEVAWMESEFARIAEHPVAQNVEMKILQEGRLYGYYGGIVIMVPCSFSNLRVAGWKA